MTPVSQGKPCAGNPHARFEEGASALAKYKTKAECSTPPSMEMLPVANTNVAN